MMEILLDLSASSSIIEKRLSKLISDVSEIKEKQDSLQRSLRFLQSRKSGGDYQRGFLQSTEYPLPQHPRKATSPISSTPVKKKPAWYLTDSFAVSPPTHSHLLAQSSFEMGYQSLSVKEEATKQYPLSPLPHHNQSQREIPQDKLPDRPENKENNCPDLSSKSVTVEGLSIPLNSDVIMNIRYVSSSRRNFSANLNHKLFTMDERKMSNVNGVLGKSKLDPVRVQYIRKVTFQIYPVTSKESEAVEWSSCISAIDEVNRRLNSKKNKK